MAITVQVQQGTLAGTASADGVVRAFLGVPYAQPPVGPLRWRLPQPPAPWEGQRPADSFGPNSPQFPMLPNSLFAGGHENQSEDCLYLNVWTAAQSAQERRPVIVFVHLGAFQYGGSSLEIYGGESLARQGPVVVTINYRLNRFGFFAHPDLSRESPHGASGNYGLHDQIAALQWIRANIGAFGGDQDCVTMFGVSAGGVSINALMASPLARGLFHRAISGSGSALGRLGTSSGLSESLQDLESAERTGVAIAKQLGVSTLEQLRAVAPDDLMMAPAPASGTVEWFYEAPAQPFARGGLDGGYPVIDGYLLPERPFDIYARGAQAQIPLMTGSTAGEAGAAPYIQTLERFNADARETYGPMLEEYLALYPAHNDDEARRASAQTFADQIFISGNWTHARLHSRAQDSAAVIAQRMAKASDEMSHWAEYDYVIVNDDLDLSVVRIRAILAAERLKRRRQAGLADFVKTLQQGR